MITVDLIPGADKEENGRSMAERSMEYVKDMAQAQAPDTANGGGGGLGTL